MPEPIDDLYARIAVHCAADAGLVSVFGAATFLAQSEARPGQPLPCAVLTDVSDKVEHETDATGRSYVAELGFQVAVFAAGRGQSRQLARAVARSLESADDAGSLSYTEGTLIHLRRRGRGLTQLDPDKGPDGEDVWMTVIEFSAYSDERNT